MFTFLRALWQWLVSAQASSPTAHRQGRAEPSRGPISGKVRHQRVYHFHTTNSGQSSTRCRHCGRDRQSVFSDCIGESGARFRCCMWCFQRHAGEAEARRVRSRSKYVDRVLLCIDALELLHREFPDPARRPYGETSLLAEIEQPYSGYEGIERVLAKIFSRSWTEFDLARIEGRPEPEKEIPREHRPKG